MRFLFFVGCLACALSARADEVDDLVRLLGVPARFEGQSARFQLERFSALFQEKDGPKTVEWHWVRDRGKIIALATRDGIHLLAFRPEEGKDTVALPKGRWHIDTMLGAAISTGSFMPGSSTTVREGYSESWSGEGTERLVLIRTYRGPRTERRVRVKRAAGEDKYETVTQEIEAENRFTVRLDPVHGYMVEGVYRITMANPPPSHQFSNLLAEGTYALWPGQARGDRTVITPVGGGYEGYALNLQAIDLSDNHRPVIRNGGFGAFLHGESGWSPAMTLEGAEADFVICNAHGDIDFVSRWPREPGAERSTLTVKHRLLALPPEMTRHVWNEMKMLFTEKSTVTIRIGRVEDFEDQPLAADRPVRGIINTTGMRLADGGRSGLKSLLVKGRVWPNLPQIALEPESRYRLEAWFRVAPGKLREEGPEPQAWIQADLYEWSPHTQKMDVEQETNRVGPGDWQKVSLEFTTPTWDPFVNIVFHCENGEAHLDDFQFVKLP